MRFPVLSRPADRRGERLGRGELVGRRVAAGPAGAGEQLDELGEADRRRRARRRGPARSVATASSRWPVISWISAIWW